MPRRSRLFLPPSLKPIQPQATQMSADGYKPQQTSQPAAPIEVSLSSDKPLFSIITPTIGRDSLIRACRALDYQTETRWEHIVCFDGESWPDYLVQQIKHPQRKLLVTGQPVRDYGNTPRRVATQVAQGQYLLYLDDDVFYHSVDGLAKVASEIELVKPIWGILKAAGGHLYEQPPPKIKHIDTAHIVHRREIASWPDTRKPEADGMLGETLASMHQPHIFDCPALAYYEKPLKTMLDTRPAILTSLEHSYFGWFGYWLASIREHVNWPVYVVDLGLKPKQVEWCLAHGVGLLRPRSGFEFWSENDQQRWLRYCAIATGTHVQLRGHNVYLHIDVDTLVLKHPEKLLQGRFSIYKHVTTNGNIHNRIELYQLMPTGSPIHVEIMPNGGVVTWKVKEAQDILQAFEEIYSAASKDANIAKHIQYSDQGMWIWALHRAKAFDCVIDDSSCNFPADNVPLNRMHERKLRLPSPTLIEEVRKDHPDAVVVHWLGTEKPWNYWS